MYACEVWMRLMSVQVLCGDEANVLYWKSSQRQNTTHLTLLKHQNTKTALYKLPKNYCLLFCVRQEKNYLWQSLWITLYFFWQCFFLRSVSACWLAALVPTVPLWWGNPYKQKQVLMTNIKILFPFPHFLKIEMKRFDKTIEEDWAFGEDCKCFFPISNVRVTKLWKNETRIQTVYMPSN